MPISANIMRSISTTFLVQEFHIPMVEISAYFSVKCDDFDPDELFSL